MTLGPIEKAILHAFVAGRVESRAVAYFADELAAAKDFMSAGVAEALEGKDVSVALRAAGFNRNYDALPKSAIVYRRRG